MARWANVPADAFADALGFDAADSGVLAFWTHAREAWPEVWVDADAFMSSLKDLRLRRPDPARAADLILAVACARGDAAALQTFEQSVIKRLGPALARVDGRQDVIDEACQRVRTRLLVGEDGRGPRLCEYRGESPLWIWVKTIAVRLMVDLARSNRREDASDPAELEARLISSGTFDLDLFRERHRQSIVRAFSDGLLQLDAQERSLLRLAFVEGLSVDRIAVIYGKSRATAARWVAAARDRLRDLVRQRIADELDLNSSELESFFAQLDFSLDKSLRVFLAPKSNEQ